MGIVFNTCSTRTFREDVPAAAMHQFSEVRKDTFQSFRGQTIFNNKKETKTFYMSLYIKKQQHKLNKKP